MPAVRATDRRGRNAGHHSTAAPTNHAGADEQLRCAPQLVHSQRRKRPMPTLAVFYGITIAMYFNDHPPPHFHVRYGGKKARIALDDLRVLGGDFPPQGLRLVRKWAKAHPQELAEAWEHCKARTTPTRIEPLR